MIRLTVICASGLLLASCSPEASAPTKTQQSTTQTEAARQERLKREGQVWSDMAAEADERAAAKSRQDRP